MESKNCEKAFSCDICYEMFNESDRRPKILKCGHSFCDSCLIKLYTGRPRCSNCNVAIKYGSPELIPINYTLENVISTSKGRARKLPSQGYCEKHDNFKELRCIECETWVCGICATLDHNDCSTKPMLIEDYNALKMQVSQKIKRELKEKQIQTRIMTKSLVALKQDRMSLIEVIKLKQSELQHCEKQIQEMECEIFSERDFCEKLSKLKIRFEGNNEENSFVCVKNELESLLNQRKIQSIQSTHALTLQSLTVLCGEKPVYAILDEIDSTLYGEVMVKDGRIRVCSFQKKKPSSTLISFNELLISISGSQEIPKRAFLNLIPKVAGDKEAFEVEVETHEESPKGKNFLLLCSALKGQTYKGMTMQHMGIFPFYSLSPGPPCTGEKMCRNVSKTPFREGLVFWIGGNESSFGISLKDCPDFMHQHNFGVVISGLQKLKEINNTNSKGLIIKDCGLIL